MADLFAIGAAWLSSQLRSHASRTITITNRLVNPTITIETPASVGRSEWDEVAADGSVQQLETRDWLVDVADLVDAGGTKLNIGRGWIVTDSLDGRRYEVYAPPGIKPKRMSDRSDKRARIHSRNLDDDN